MNKSEAIQEIISTINTYYPDVLYNIEGVYGGISIEVEYKNKKYRALIASHNSRYSKRTIWHTVKVCIVSLMRSFNND